MTTSPIARGRINQAAEQRWTTSPRRISRDWMNDAACRDCDPEVFFPSVPPSSSPQHAHNAAKLACLICSECPVQRQCLEYSLTLKISYGVWGGVCAPERLRMMGRRTP